MSWRSYVVSRISLRISQDDHLDKTRGIKPYLIRAYKWRDEGGRYVSFAVMYTNLASISSAISRIELRVAYVDDLAEVRSVLLSPDNCVKGNFETGLSRLSLPLNISAKASVSGWLVFRIPDNFDRNKFIESYSVDAHSLDSKVTVTSYLLHEISEVNREL